jgi:hypothetical protein
MAKPVSDSKLSEVEISTPTDSDDENVAVPWRNYVALIILFVINLLNFMDRYTVAGSFFEQINFDNSSGDGIYSGPLSPPRS